MKPYPWGGLATADCIIWLTSVPGRVLAIILNNYSTLVPILALTSIKFPSNSFARSDPCYQVTYFWSVRSVLLATIKIITSVPLSLRTSSIHLFTETNDCFAVLTYLINTCHIIADNCYCTVPYVAWNETSKSLLPCRVP